MGEEKIKHVSLECDGLGKKNGSSPRQRDDNEDIRVEEPGGHTMIGKCISFMST